MPSEIKKITSTEEFKTALKEAGTKKVIVDFYAKWCTPCRTVASLYDELSAKYSDSCVTLSVDVDELEEVAAECGVTAMPTFQVYKVGSKVDQLVGVSRRDQLENLFLKPAP